MPGEDIWSWSVTASANGTADTNINWAENQARASVNDSSRSMMAALAKNRDLQSGNIVTTGTPNAQEFVSGVGYTAIPSGLRVLLWNGAGTNTGSVSLNMDGIGSTPVKDRLGASLIGGELPLGTYFEAVYDSTNWRILTFPPPQPILLNTTTIDNASAIDYSGALGDFTKYVFVLTGITPGTDNAAFYFQVSIDGGATWEHGPADYSWVNHDVYSGSTTPFIEVMPATSAMRLATALGKGANESLQGEIEVYVPTSTRYMLCKWSFAQFNDGAINLWTGAGATVKGPVNGLRLIMSTGNIATGQVLLYGIDEKLKGVHARLRDNMERIMDHKLVDGVKYPLSDAEIAAKKAHEAEWEAEAPARQAKKDRKTGLQGEPAARELVHLMANATSPEIDAWFDLNVTTPAQAIDVLKTVVKVLALKL